HRSVSRKHFVVEWDPGLARLVGEDLASKNGTWLDGVRLASSRRVLDDNTVIRLGDTLFVLELDAPPSPLPADLPRDAVPARSRPAGWAATPPPPRAIRRRCCSSARPAPARSTSPRRSIARAAAAARSRRSTARSSPPSSSRASCSATRAARSPARPAITPAC